MQSFGGFAFVPHNREAIDGDVTFGHTSLSFEWIEQHAEGWNMVGCDHSLIDPFQLLVYLVLKHHKVWRRLLRFPCKLSNAPRTRGVFKQKFEHNDGRKKNESQARKQCQYGCDRHYCGWQRNPKKTRKRVIQRRRPTGLLGRLVLSRMRPARCFLQYLRRLIVPTRLCSTS